MSEPLDISGRTVTLKTGKGTLTITPMGRIEGLWPIVQRELLAGERVRQLAARRLYGSESPNKKPVPRSTLIYWRQHNDFPAPVVAFKGAGAGELELWSRTEVEAWLRALVRKREAERIKGE